MGKSHSTWVFTHGFPTKCYHARRAKMWVFCLAGKYIAWLLAGKFGQQYARYYLGKVNALYIRMRLLLYRIIFILPQQLQFFFKLLTRRLVGRRSFCFIISTTSSCRGGSRTVSVELGQNYRHHLHVGASLTFFC
jgi:hypothetical protein